MRVCVVCLLVTSVSLQNGWAWTDRDAVRNVESGGAVTNLQAPIVYMLGLRYVAQTIPLGLTLDVRGRGPVAAAQANVNKQYSSVPFDQLIAQQSLLRVSLQPDRCQRHRRCSLGAKPQPHALTKNKQGRLSTAAHKKNKWSLHYEVPPPPRIWSSGKSQKWLTPRLYGRTKYLFFLKPTAWPAKGLKETGDHVLSASLRGTYRHIYASKRVTDFEEMWQGDEHRPLTAKRLLNVWIFEKSKLALRFRQCDAGRYHPNFGAWRQGN